MEKGVEVVEKSQFALEARPGKVAYIEYDGSSPKALYPKTRYFTLLDRRYNPHDYEGGYISTVTTRLDKNNNEFYIAIPHLQLPSFTEMDDFCLKKIFDSIPKRNRHEYAFSMYQEYIDMVSTFSMPLSTIVFRMLRIYMNQEIDSDEITPERAGKQYRLLINNIGPKTSDKEIRFFCNQIGLDDTVRDFIQILYTLTETDMWDEISRLLKLLSRRQDTSDNKFYLVPNIRHSDTFFFNKYRERFPYGSNVTAAIIYTNFEVDICNVPEMILEYGDRCLNYAFNMIDASQLIVKMKEAIDVGDSGIRKTGRDILKRTEDFNNEELRDFAISSSRSVIHKVGNGDNFLGMLRKKVIQI